MGKIVLMFSGQGTQYAGMGRELYEISSAARGIMNRVEELRPGTIRQCFMGDETELARTENTQPCVFCVSLAAAAALREAGIAADMLAGFSLGEFAALTFSNAVSVDTGFKLVCERGKLMQKASETTNAGMLAVLKLPDETVTRLCAGFDRVYPVNFNCPGQVAVAGARDELEAFKMCVKEAGGKAIPLKTSGGFHSPFMERVSDEFTKILNDTEIKEPQLPLYSNVTATPYNGDIKVLLAKQMYSPVRWSDIVTSMIRSGADRFIEVGPGKTLSGFVSRISDTVRVWNAEDMRSINKTAEEIYDA